MMSNDYRKLSYWFSDSIVDPNGKTTSDINRGIQRICKDLVNQLNDLDNNYTKIIINNDIQGQPDAVADLKYNNDDLWWYVCLSNGLEDPIADFNTDMVFYIFDEDILTNHSITEQNIKATQNQESKIGKIVELN
jgi:hypothetical protein